METIQPSVPTQPGTPAPDAGGATKAMRSAYNRAGLGIFAVYNVLQLVGSLLFGGAVGVLVVTKLLSQLMDADLDVTNLPQMISRIMQMLSEPKAHFILILFYTLGSVVGMLVGLLVLRAILGKSAPVEKRSLGAGKFLMVVLMSFGLWGVGALFGNLPSFFNVNESLGTEFLQQGAGAWLMYLYVCIGAPFFEELVCRKLLLDKLHPFGEGFAAIASGLLFGLIHGNSAQFFLAFLLGTLFAMVYLRTGKVIYTMLLHAIINTTASLPDLFQLGGIDIVLGWDIAVGCLVVAGLITLIVMRKDAILHPIKSTVENANRSAWRNVGMILYRIFGLVTLVSTDLILIYGSFSSGQGPASLLRLIPTAAAIVLVLLLPRLTRRFEGKPAEPSDEGAALAS